MCKLDLDIVRLIWMSFRVPHRCDLSKPDRCSGGDRQPAQWVQEISHSNSQQHAEDGKTQLCTVLSAVLKGALTKMSNIIHKCVLGTQFLWGVWWWWVVCVLACRSGAKQQQCQLRTGSTPAPWNTARQAPACSEVSPLSYLWFWIERCACFMLCYIQWANPIWTELATIFTLRW